MPHSLLHLLGQGELIEAWRIFTPLLHDIDEQRPDPVPYKFGSLYPPGYEAWSAAKGVKQPDNWVAGVVRRLPTSTFPPRFVQEEDSVGSNLPPIAIRVGAVSHVSYVSVF